MIRRLLACLVMLSSAQAAFAGPIRDSITRAAWASVQEPGWRHVSGSAMIVSGGAMVGTGATLVVGANTSMNVETVNCSVDTVSSCRYRSREKKAALPWGLRVAGAGVALTILGANISIQHGSFKVSKSVGL